MRSLSKSILKGWAGVPMLILPTQYVPPSSADKFSDWRLRCRGIYIRGGRISAP